MSEILLVSSSTEALEDLERLLTSHDRTVQTVRDGAAALASARRTPPDLVVSDVVMPVMDGYYLLRLWKNDPELRKIPFVICTSMQTDASDKEFGLRLGADAFLTRPSPDSILLARLEEVLSSRQVAVSSITDAKTFLAHYREALPRKAGASISSVVGTSDPAPFGRIDPEAIEGELEFRQVTEAMPQIVWVTRPDGWHTHFNQRWLDYTGLTLAESLGHGWLAPFHPEDQPRAAVRWAEANTTGEPYEIEYRLRAADGTYRWMLGRALPLRNGAGTIVKWMGTCTDIHDLKEAQSAVVEAQRRQRLILESVGEGIHGLDTEGRIVFENPAAIAMFGWDQAAMIGRDAHAMVHHHTADGELYDPVDCPIYQTLRDGNVRRSSNELFFRRDGSSFPVEYVTSPVIDDEGMITGAVVSFRDVTEQRAALDQLDKNATMLRIAGKVARLGGWTIDLPDRILTWSDESAAIHDRPAGYQPSLEEGIGHFLPEHREEVKRTIEECARSGKAYAFELPKITATGRRIWVRSTGKAVRDSEGRIIRLQGAFQDITERKEAEQLMREKDAITRIASRMTRTGGWAVDALTSHVFWSDELAQLLGYPEVSEQQMQDSISLYLSPGKEILTEALAQCMSDGTPLDLEAQLRRGDGETIWVHVTGEAVRGQDGLIVRIHGALQDISERKRTERALRDQASLLDLAQDAILVRDLDHHILYWNRSAERLYGWTAGEVHGRSAVDLLYSDASLFRKATESTLARGEWTGELEQVTRAGEKILVEGHWSVVRDDDGAPRSILAINTDITEKKELEAQFLRAQRLDSIGTLASGIAHDFNNLLAPIVMGVSFLKRGETREKVLAVVDNIERSAERGKQLVRQILSFARGIEGERAPVDFGQVIRETEGIIADIFPRSITVQQDLDEDLWMAVADSTQVTQVLLNLCVNAREAMPDGGRLVTRATNVVLDRQTAEQHGAVEGEPFVLIEVSDEGSGIPTDVRNKIFEPFFTTKPFGTGTGLGLSTALGIVRSHGGFIDFDTEPGSGTTFRVYFPAQPDARPAGLPVQDPESAPRGNGQAILIIDDEASILNVMQHTLEAYGYRSFTAEDGPRALALYERMRDEIDLVITDLMMPGMDGLELIRELQRLNPAIRIIAASGKGNSVDEILNQTGVSAFLRKPYSAERLLSTLAEVLGG